MSLWGPLAERYEAVRPRKMLALDGGGIRGMLTLEILAEMERQLAEVTASDDTFRLCDFFDYIGGTSTGAIISAGLARGMSVAELHTFYREVGPSMFDRAALFRRFRNLYKAEPLRQELMATFGEDTNLFPEHLRCLLLVVTRNVTTDSPWPISSNPHALFNDPARPDCNLRIPLWQLVRASTAAPIFFPPEVLQWDKEDSSSAFVFVDGGVTPYNNPAFLLFRMATLPQYKLGWNRGERDLLLVSVGTGSTPKLDEDILSPDKNAISNLAGLPGALMYGSLVDQDVNCRAIGRCVHGAPIDSELGDMLPRGDDGEVLPLDIDLGSDFLYARYNADLSREGLDALGLSDIDPDKVQKLDSVQHLDDLLRVGRSVAKGVRVQDFGPFVTRRDRTRP